MVSSYTGILFSKGIRNIVVNPASIEVAANDRVKTDKRDSRKLSVHLEANRLKAIMIPSPQQEQARLITRTREQLVSQRTRLGNQFKAKLRQFGMFPFDEERAMSEKFIDSYLRIEMAPPIKSCLEVIANLWKYVDKQIKHMRTLMKEQSKSDPIEQVYLTVPGVGPISARILSNELGNMSQFKNQRALYSHTGLTPSEFSSGQRERKGHITRQGNSRLRFILTEISWKAIKEDKKLEEDFRRISHRRGKKRAIIAVARRLIGRIRACFMKQQSYQLGFGV